MIPYFLYLTFFFFSLGQVGRISFFGQQLNIYWYEIFLAMVLLVWLITYKLLPFRNSFRSLRIVIVFFSYLFFGFIIGILNYTYFENLIAFLYLIRLIFYGFFAAYLFFWVKQSNIHKTVLFHGIVIFGTLSILFAMIQYFIYPDLRNLIYAGWDPHLYRLFGTFFDTAVAGAVYGLMFIFVYIYGIKFLKNKYWLYTILGVLVILMVLTFSRNLYFSISVLMLIFALARKKLKEFFLLMLIFSAVLFFSPKPSGEGVNLTRIFSIQSRLEDHKNAVKVWKKNYWLGIGYNRIRYEKIKLNIIERFNSDITHSGASFHSSFLIILVTSGLVGLILFIILLIRLGTLNEFAKYGVIFLSLMSLNDNILLHPFLIFLYFNLLALNGVSPVRK